MKHKYDIKLLRKTGGSRFDNVDTYKIVCKNPQSIQVTQSLKPSSEDGSDQETFVHVALANLVPFHHQVIVKVHFSSTRAIRRELEALRLVKDSDNVVQYVCHIPCMDDKKRWKERLTGPCEPCKEGGLDSLTFLIMEYIEGGNVRDFLSKHRSRQEYLSLFQQTALVLMDIGYKYNLYHGDLHGGNIMIKRTAQITRTYRIQNETYKVKTHGIHPVLIDFGRSGFYQESHDRKTYIFDDILSVFDRFANLIKEVDTELSERVWQTIYSIDTSSDMSFGDMMKKIKETF